MRSLTSLYYHVRGIPLDNCASSTFTAIISGFSVKSLFRQQKFFLRSQQVAKSLPVFQHLRIRFRLPDRRIFGVCVDFPSAPGDFLTKRYRQGPDPRQSQSVLCMGPVLRQLLLPIVIKRTHHEPEHLQRALLQQSTCRSGAVARMHTRNVLNMNLRENSFLRLVQLSKKIKTFIRDFWVMVKTSLLPKPVLPLFSLAD